MTHNGIQYRFIRSLNKWQLPNHYQTQQLQEKLKYPLYLLPKQDEHTGPFLVPFRYNLRSEQVTEWETSRK